MLKRNEPKKRTVQTKLPPALKKIRKSVKVVRLPAERQAPFTIFYYFFHSQPTPARRLDEPTHPPAGGFLRNNEKVGQRKGFNLVGRKMRKMEIFFVLSDFLFYFFKIILFLNYF